MKKGLLEMVLAEKIAMLRRRHGWAQKGLGVSRQSASGTSSAVEYSALFRVFRTGRF